MGKNEDFYDLCCRMPNGRLVRRFVKQNQASKAARLLGAIKSEKKAAAARRNGKLGGYYKHFRKKK